MRAKRRRKVKCGLVLARAAGRAGDAALAVVPAGQTALDRPPPHVVRIPRRRNDRRVDHLRRHRFRGVDLLRDQQEGHEDPPPPPPLVLDQYI